MRFGGIAPHRPGQNTPTSDPTIFYQRFYFTFKNFPLSNVFPKISVECHPPLGVTSFSQLVREEEVLRLSKRFRGDRAHNRRIRIASNAVYPCCVFTGFSTQRKAPIRLGVGEGAT